MVIQLGQDSEPRNLRKGKVNLDHTSGNAAVCTVSLAAGMAEAGSSLSFEAALSPSPLAVCKEDKVVEPGPHTAGH